MHGARETRAAFLHVPAAKWINRPAAAHNQGLVGAHLATGLVTAVALLVLMLATLQDGLSDSGTTAAKAGASVATEGTGSIGYLPDLFAVPADTATDQPPTF